MMKKFVKAGRTVPDYNYSKNLLSSVFVIAFSLIFASCFSDTHGGLKAIEENLKAADEAELRGDLALAEDYVRQAERVGKNYELGEEVISAQIRLAEIQLARRQPDRAEATYLEVKSFCVERSCDRLGDIYQDLLFLYISVQKEPAKAFRVIDELRALPANRLDESTKERITRFADECRAGRLTDKLENKVLQGR